MKTAKFKDTELGPIRSKSGWTSVKLGDLGIWHKGQPLSKADIVLHGLHECIHYGELFTSYGPIIATPISSTNREPVVTSKYGDILFPSSDVTPEGLGRCSTIQKDDVILGGDIIILRPQSGVCPEFLSYVINQNKRKIIAKVTGTTVRHITSKALATIEISMPRDIAEQQAIADVLSDMDKNIAAIEAKRDKYIRIKEGAMRDLLTGKVRI